MKSTISQSNQEPEQKLVYPVLMQQSTYKYVVLFCSEQVGVVVHEGTKISQGNPIYNLGYYSHGWLPATNAEGWRKFEGKIELSN